MVARFAIDRDADIGVFLETLFHGRGQRAFQRPEYDFTRHVLFTRQSVNQQKNFATHRFLPLKSRTGSSLARSMSSSVKLST